MEAKIVLVTRMSGGSNKSQDNVKYQNVERKNVLKIMGEFHGHFEHRYNCKESYLIVDDQLIQKYQ